MKNLLTFSMGRIVAGFLVLAPVYLACLLLLKAMKSIMGLMAPVTKVLPKSVSAENLVALILLLVICFFVGLAVRTRMGRGIKNRLDRSVFQKIPGYSLLRSLTQRLAGETQDQAWDAALIEIEDALVPGFIIEELVDGRFTVFVPSVPTPMAGAVYVLTPDRVHRLDVPFTQAIATITKWGSGCKNLVAAMKQKESV
ncbi:DUF502 domain-containing protein [Edaphobacter modestus]|uniref:Putative membrane protein n=1 Tax=Edaphobacter modestus TaxID=388466 RepID=A0A4Q7YYR6_9BACT|nr:DUF502 domain-containing protein [Edaphobacter modestus]RZU42289.1 putative membrane protein [Edaphobacter modestus]